MRAVRPFFYRLFYRLKLRKFPFKTRRRRRRPAQPIGCKVWLEDGSIHDTRLDGPFSSIPAAAGVLEINVYVDRLYRDGTGRRCRIKYGGGQDADWYYSDDGSVYGTTSDRNLGRLRKRHPELHVRRAAHASDEFYARVYAESAADYEFG